MSVAVPITRAAAAQASGERVAPLCSNERRQKREIFEPGAEKVRARLADLAAAATVGELVAGKPHPLVGDLAGKYALYLDGGRRLVFNTLKVRYDGGIPDPRGSLGAPARGGVERKGA